MFLKEFIKSTLDQLDEMKDGIVEFDLGIQVHHADTGDNARKIIVNDLSKNRIRFSVMLKSKATPNNTQSEKGK